MTTSQRVFPLAEIAAWREAQRKAGRRVVVTNGCFDLLHVGHIAYLEAARSQGDLLLIGVNSDASVAALKGPARPINPEADRARLLAALAAVDAVTIFPEKRAGNFLERVRPDVWVKGGDYSLETIDVDERRILESVGGRIVFIPFITGKSTSSLLEKIQRL